MDHDRNHHDDFFGTFKKLHAGDYTRPIGSTIT